MLVKVMVLEDRWGRQIRYLRLSVTSRCGMRCLYCRPPGTILPQASRADTLLTLGEIRQLVGHLVARHGVEKVRITGGEPTLRADIVEIVREVASVPGLADLGLTTNGLRLEALAESLAAAGLRRINVSLDTLDPGRFRQITGVDGLDEVLRGLEAARRAGLLPIRVNCVVMRGINDDELDELLQWGLANGWEVRFIELMPIGPLSARWNELFVPVQEMISRLTSVREFHAVSERKGVARLYEVILQDGHTGRVGFITPMSEHFCGQCDRIRITAEGRLHACLMTDQPVDLLPALRPRFDSARLDLLIEQALRRKQPVHPGYGMTMMTVLGG
ncbi:MAG: GTP 3',8-cyclase MoaA [Thermogutta sp.]